MVLVEPGGELGPDTVEVPRIDLPLVGDEGTGGDDGVAPSSAEGSAEGSAPAPGAHRLEAEEPDDVLRDPPADPLPDPLADPLTDPWELVRNTATDSRSSTGRTSPDSTTDYTTNSTTGSTTAGANTTGTDTNTHQGEPTMADANHYDQTLDQIEEGVNGFIGASIVDLDSGMPLVSRSRRDGFDLDVASAYNSEMVKAKLNTMRLLNINSGLEDMLLTLGDQLHLIKILNRGTFVYVAVDRAATNLALLRNVVNRAAASIA
ncbi:MAG: hypothetical protein WAW88_14390 [Nocardioides sp.]